MINHDTKITIMNHCYLPDSLDYEIQSRAHVNTASFIQKTYCHR